MKKRAQVLKMYDDYAAGFRHFLGRGLRLCAPTSLEVKSYDVSAQLVILYLHNFKRFPNMTHAAEHHAARYLTESHGREDLIRRHLTAISLDGSADSQTSEEPDKASELVQFDRLGCSSCAQ
jgi:hypothetical protein